MNRTAEYQRHADFARTQAQVAAGEGEKAKWLGIADAWDALAKDGIVMPPDPKPDFAAPRTA